MSKKLTQKEFLERINEISPDIEILSDYCGQKGYVKCRCKKCGREWEATGGNLLNGRKCRECSYKERGKRRKKNIEDFISEANSIYNDFYDYSKFKYVDSHTKGIIICPIHGEFECSPTNHTSNKRGCPKCGIEKCAKHNSSNTEEFIPKAIKIHGNKYDYSRVNYVNNHTKIEIICHEKDMFGKEHGSFWQTPGNHLFGRGCPICRQSHGERFISNYLNNNKINYIPQYLVNIDTDINFSGKSYIDFYLPDHNLFIEYNGQQHYMEVKSFGGTFGDSKLEFDKQQKRDQYIRDYCKNNNIRLLEIPYNKTWEEITELLNTTIYE